MEDCEKRLIGEELEPGGRPKAPGRLELLQRFVNTHNHEFPDDWDRLGTPEKATEWLRAKGLIGPRETVSDVERLRVLREAIRALLVDPQPDAFAALSGRAQLKVVVDAEGRTALAPVRRGVDGAVATLLGILHEAQLAGDWSRMKACRQCEYAFYDRSKNRSAAWCSMSICGNRTKNRTYYRRHKA
ncbi:CGNR zinc finger domain-containing protein [Solirubrobacter soli]|uniref:CGNR zinc finger domain-containing protein n=1 Tax=Solirubrobacter soli TaxID=363832 RepID=UPI0003F835DF|nr:CGNR zinc finger domain-containing protein [Solirubrobacter soli]